MVAVAGDTVTVVATGAVTVTAASPLILVTVPEFPFQTTGPSVVAVTVAAPAAAPVTVTVDPFGASVTIPAGDADQSIVAVGIGWPF